jgi:hypothetical protein
MQSPVASASTMHRRYRRNLVAAVECRIKQGGDHHHESCDDGYRFHAGAGEHEPWMQIPGQESYCPCWRPGRKGMEAPR